MTKNLKLRRLHWILISIMMFSAMIYSAANIRTCSAQETPSTIVSVDPAQSVFTDAIAGTKFDVNVSIANVTGFGGGQFRLEWNASFLICTNMTEVLFHALTPPDSWSNIWSLKKEYNNTGDVNQTAYALWAQAWQDNDAARAAGYAPGNVTTANFPPEGKVAMATLTFQIVQVPTDPSAYYESNITLFPPYTKLSDMDALPINFTIQNGYFRVYGTPQTVYHQVTKDSTTYTVTTVSNATVPSGSMAYVPDWKLVFNVTGTDGTTAYVNLTIPKDLVRLNQTTDQWSVTVDGTQVTPIVSENATHTFLYVTTSLSTKTVTVLGTIPEFPILMTVPLLMAGSLIALGLRRRKRL